MGHGDRLQNDTYILTVTWYVGDYAIVRLLGQMGQHC